VRDVQLRVEGLPRRSNRSLGHRPSSDADKTNNADASGGGWRARVQTGRQLSASGETAVRGRRRRGSGPQTSIQALKKREEAARPATDIMPSDRAPHKQASARQFGGQPRLPRRQRRGRLSLARGIVAIEPYADRRRPRGASNAGGVEVGRSELRGAHPHRRQPGHRLVVARTAFWRAGATRSDRSARCRRQTTVHGDGEPGSGQVNLYRAASVQGSTGRSWGCR